MKKAVLFKKQDDKKVKCTACAQYCTINPGNSGICGVRENINGELYLIAYGKAAAVNIDPIEKKPLFHFMPGTRILSIGTLGCNLGCEFCQNASISQANKEKKLELIKKNQLEKLKEFIDKNSRDLSPKDIVTQAADENIPAIAFTYNEPAIIHEYVIDTAKLAKKKGIKTVIVTNGYESAEAMESIGKYVEAMNIDLKAHDEAFYSRVCKARLQPVLDTIRSAHEKGIWIEITTLLIPGENDSTAELQKTAKFIASVSKSIPWHITAFHPDYKMQDKKRTEENTLIHAYEIGKKAGLKFVYVGNVSNTDLQSTHCPACGEILVARDWHRSQIQGIIIKNNECRCKNCKEKIEGVWS
jgi:pyruvate formate lyase activating enzyme